MHVLYGDGQQVCSSSGTDCKFALVLNVGKCIPITRGAGIYQPHMGEALERLNEGNWVSKFLSVALTFLGDFFRLEFQFSYFCRELNYRFITTLISCI